jgi:hypothetical protein
VTPSNDIPSSITIHYLQRGCNQLPNGFTLHVKWSAISSWSAWRYEKFGRPPRLMVVHLVHLAGSPHFCQGSQKYHEPEE